MKPEFANPVIEISSKVSNSHFLILEQIMPDSSDNSFATKMLYHFNHLRSPIQCVEHYPTKELQMTRFRQYYSSVEVKNLFENWLYLVDDEMKSKISQVEEFDEWEEFIIFCQHYVLVHGTNTDQLIYETPNGEIESKEYPMDTTVTMVQDSRFNAEQLEIKFPAITSVDSKIYVNGGLKQTRTNEMLELDLESGTISNVEMNLQPSARMCHTLTTLADNKMLLVGGRSRPGLHFQDVYLCNKGVWEKLPDMPVKRSRHACVSVTEAEVLLFGGLTDENNDSDKLFLQYDVRSGTSKELKIKGDSPGNLLSCSMNYDGEFGYIFGGISNHNVPIVNDKLYKFKIIDDTIEIESVYQDYLLSRIGSQSKLLGNKLLIVGGVSTIKMLTKKTNIMTLELADFKWKYVQVPEQIRKTSPPIFIGFGLVEKSSHKQRDASASYFMLGGGAVCYSFGSCFNSVYRLDIVN
ncbi:uncharacterized protein SPAPADRAFT_57777 [Spathaspora passalidarum NRRL Y-27907]|uniref:Uncharacterized protein n=1 Tax=Spathaspora passalidarum (strain NRRL Y-27907 / 11-Y1) TaxID=619300 RepID=G3ADZ0_SPAPN|nr:uncharacterized protein SPAPADRAFT_57777 [Spathaspora passalidarum NRRL Y-27907]EGW34714.1 hypothetical protein SPAPADRAFT_57777 [Spathaspora passalidarum NRRL Y-27907]